MEGLASTVPANRPQQTNRRCTNPNRCTPIPGPSPLREKGEEGEGSDEFTPQFEVIIPIDPPLGFQG
jgi:hypothetical protein